MEYKIFGKPNRLLEIEKILDKYYNNGENDEKMIIINKIKDKYKNELENYRYVYNLNELVVGQEIRYVSRKNYKLSNATFIVQIEKDGSDCVTNIVCKSNMSRIKKKISHLKHFIFIYHKRNKDNLLDIASGMIY